jgi:hypothetical protein
MPRMKIITPGQIVTIVCAVVLGTIIANYDELLPYRWHTFRAADGSFTVQLPSQPKVDQSQVQSATGGIVTLHQVTARPEQDAVYSLSYFNDPRLTNGPVDAALDSAQSGSLSHVQGTVLNERHFELDGYPARDIKVRVSANSLLSERLIAVHHRMFFFMVSETDTTQPDSKNIRKFFDSLKLSPQ